MPAGARRLFVFLLLILLAFCLLSCGDKSSPAFEQDLQRQMQQIVERAMAQQNIPGVVVGVWVPGRGEWVTAVGNADIETGRQMGTADKVRIASNTKTFVATLMLLLADEGKISLDDALEKYLSGVPNGDRMTLRHLLNMTSGIFSFTEDQTFMEEFTADPLMDITPWEELDIALSHPPDFPPGEGWHYSDTNYEILGIIAEQVTGNPIEVEIQRRVIEPLGLTGTSFPTTPDMPEGSAKGYVLSEGGELMDYTRVNPAVPWAGGAMISNLEDLKVWAKALATGELLSQQMHRQQLQWVAMPGAEKVGGKYGLGIMSMAGLLGHNGAIFGYNSVVMYLPEADATIVVLANKSTNSSEETMDIFFEIARLLFPERFSN